jgi:hypothetical protein
VLKKWTSAFPDFEPIAHQAKVRFADRWVRFHSLPDSKRYPEDEWESVELLARFNAVLSELVRTQAEIVLLATEFSDARVPSATSKSLPGAWWWQTVLVEDIYWHVYAMKVIWQPKQFDQLVRAAAMDAASNVMICDPDCEWLLHPYDGGMDVILSNGPTRDRLRAKFAGWLSSRPVGR